MHRMRGVSLFIAFFVLMVFAVPSAYGAEYVNPKLLATPADIEKNAGKWVVIDYKTGSPKGDHETWLRSLSERYRPQLAAYVQMAAKGLKVAEEDVRGAILFTALPRLVWLAGVSADLPEQEKEDRSHGAAHSRKSRP